jgi:hypothetical protein
MYNLIRLIHNTSVLKLILGDIQGNNNLLKREEKEMEEQELILIKRVCTISEPIYAFDKCGNNNKDFPETTKRARTNVRL